MTLKLCTSIVRSRTRHGVGRSASIIPAASGYRQHLAWHGFPGRPRQDPPGRPEWADFGARTTSSLEPVAPKLQKLLEQLKPLAEDSVPTVRDLSNIIKKPGADNDLIELTKLGVPLSQATVRDVNANGKVRPGAFPISTTALNASTPELATARPYAVDLTGWFEGYTHPGTIDANGGASRIAPVVGLGSIENGSLNLFDGLLNILPGSSDRLQFAQQTLTTGQGDRCPGSMERGALYYPESGFPCDPSEVPTGK
jgi:phospholipid/cholesterol/gamma-HCH transport system substrate-binding protein